MKYCLQCNKQYSEAWLTFCTDDGSLLREALTPPADPNWDPRIRATKFDDPSEQSTQWLPRDPPAAGAWIAPDERAPMPGPWQQPTPAPYVQANMKPPPHGLAIASLVCGIFGLLFAVVCSVPVAGILAVIFGLVSLSQLRSTPERPGKGFAIAGIIMGTVNLLIIALWVLIMILSIAFG